MAEPRRQVAEPRTSPAARAEDPRTQLTLRELSAAFTTYGADLEFACGTLRQCAEELQVLLYAKQAGCGDAIVDSVLLGIAQRMEVAAKLTCEESAW